MAALFRRKRYLDLLESKMHNHMIKVITGIRRSGKSFLLFELFVSLLRDKGVSEDHIIRIDLEDRRNKSLRDPDAILAYIDSRLKDDAMHYILLDEVQLIYEFEDVLNSYLKVKNADVYVTGSNSRFLSKDVITEFRGRGDEVHLCPLSVAEICEAMPEKSWTQVWDEYLNYGGLPLAVLAPTSEAKEDYLKGLFANTYLLDIKERHAVRGDQELDRLLDVVSSSVGSLTNPKKLEDTFRSYGSKLSSATIKDYLDYLEEAFLVERSQRYDVKGRKYISTPYKCYFTDMGLRNARLNFRQIEEPHIMENVIYNELRMRGYGVDVGIVEVRELNENGSSVRKQIEVDFVVNRGSQRYYIQSAFAMSDDEKARQEIRPLVNISDSFKKIIVIKDDILPRRDDNGVLTLGLRQFLMDGSCLDI